MICYICSRSYTVMPLTVHFGVSVIASRLSKRPKTEGMWVVWKRGHDYRPLTDGSSAYSNMTIYREHTVSGDDMFKVGV